MPPAAWKRCWAPRGTCTFASPAFQHWQPLDWGQTWWVLSSLNRPLDFCYKYSSCWACLPFILITYSGARSRTRVSSYISKWLVHLCSSLVEQQHSVGTYLVLLTYPKNCCVLLFSFEPSVHLGVWIQFEQGINRSALQIALLDMCSVKQGVCMCRAQPSAQPYILTTMNNLVNRTTGQYFARAAASVRMTRTLCMNKYAS